DSWSDGVEAEADQPAASADPDVAFIDRDAGDGSGEISRCHDRSYDLGTERSVTETPLPRDKEPGVISNEGMESPQLGRQYWAQSPGIGLGIAPEHALGRERYEGIGGPFYIHNGGLEGGALLEPDGLHQVPLSRQCDREAGFGANPDGVALEAHSARRIGERRSDRLNLGRVSLTAATAH